MKSSIYKKVMILATAGVLLVGCERGEPGGELSGGREAPGFTLKNYDGEQVSLSDYKGRIVVLEWLNYDCPFVKYHYEKAKTMASLADKYKGKEVVWISINSTNYANVESNKAFAKKHQLSYPILDDSGGKVGKAYDAKTTPHIFVIDEKGMIVYSGAIDDSPMGGKGEAAVNYVDKVLSELVGDKEVSISNTKPYGCSVKYAD